MWDFCSTFSENLNQSGFWKYNIIPSFYKLILFKNKTCQWITCVLQAYSGLHSSFGNTWCVLFSQIGLYCICILWSYTKKIKPGKHYHNLYRFLVFVVVSQEATWWILPDQVRLGFVGCPFHLGIWTWLYRS